MIKSKLSQVILLFDSVTKIFPIKYETEVWRLTHVSFSILAIFGIYKISSNLFNKKVAKLKKLKVLLVGTN